nr:hypothetical protein Iba_chr09aCG11380 [Ipomoea batatas]
MEKNIVGEGEVNDDGNGEVPVVMDDEDKDEFLSLLRPRVHCRNRTPPPATNTHCLAGRDEDRRRPQPPSDCHHCSLPLFAGRSSSSTVAYSASPETEEGNCWSIKMELTAKEGTCVFLLLAITTFTIHISASSIHHWFHIITWYQSSPVRELCRRSFRHRRVTQCCAFVTGDRSAEDPCSAGDSLICSHRSNLLQLRQ